MLRELINVVEAAENGTPIKDIMTEVGLKDNRTITFQVIGAIRLMGYDAKKKVEWNKKTAKSTSVMILVK